ncbi:MAG: peptidylprolyl isomerase [Gemmatimonadetes bacterium]|nr:peptidylprolyl isomerase [Gemmatimonadota bacterium]
MRLLSPRALGRAVLLAVGTALVAAPAAAQQVPAFRGIEVDRVAGVVGSTPILFSEVLEAINFARAQGLQLPPDSLGQIRVAREFLNRIIDREVLIAVAKDYKIEIAESDVAQQVERDLDRARSQFRTDAEFRAALQRDGFGTPEEYRKKAVEAAIRDESQRRAIDSLKAKGRMAPANVTEREVSEAFERLRTELPPRPATVGFRQVVVKIRPRAESIARARALIDSIRLELEKGASFEDAAKRFSMDGTAEKGGDLDWNRRGVMVPEFERMMFALIPGRISPIVETQYGFHIIRVDRVRAGEVRARHILIKPAVDSQDLASSRALADTVLALWKQGTPYDTLLAKYHDYDEERSIPEGLARDSLPAEYRVALKDIPVQGFTPIFALPDRGSGFNKWAIAQVLVSKPEGRFTLEEYQENIRKQLREEKSIRRTLDNLRREIYVSLRI